MEIARWKATLFDNARTLRDNMNYPFSPGQAPVFDAVVRAASAYGIGMTTEPGLFIDQLLSSINKNGALWADDTGREFIALTSLRDEALDYDVVKEIFAFRNDGVALDLNYIDEVMRQRLSDVAVGGQGAVRYDTLEDLVQGLPKSVAQRMLDALEGEAKLTPNSVATLPMSPADLPALPGAVASYQPVLRVGSRVTNLEFANDLDKALYVVGGSRRLSEDGEFLSYLQKLLPDKKVGELRDMGRVVRRTTREALDSVDDVTDAFKVPATEMLDDVTRAISPMIPPESGGTPTWVSSVARQMNSGSPHLDDFEKTFGRLRKGIEDNWGTAIPVTGGGVDEAAAVSRWAEGAEAGMIEARGLAARMGDAARNFTLLNYLDRKNLDLALAYIYPYHFWYGRTYKNWFSRITSAPGVIAGYAKYKEALSKIHAGAPDWWKQNINTNELFGLDSDNPLYFNLEATLNPLHGLTGVDFNDPYRRATWYSSMIDDLNRFGPSTFTPFNFAAAFALMGQGEMEAASRLGGRLFPQTSSFKALFSAIDRGVDLGPLGSVPGTGVDLSESPLLGLLAKDPAVGFFSGGLDPYERGRVGRAIGAMITESPEMEAELLEQARLQDGPLWDEAIARATNARAGGQLSSFLFGVGFKGRTQEDLEIDRFYGTLNRLFEMRPNLSPDEFRGQMNQLRQAFPFMDGVLLARKAGGPERDV
ncbi:MAG: hypothetical protein JRE40_03020, partial [Deltaproteobacteria bacterium]|nr:hypothetical protein [Deltaproteobacteria bacterium]